jgi:hypothetical protein
VAAFEIGEHKIATKDGGEALERTGEGNAVFGAAREAGDVLAL